MTITFTPSDGGAGGSFTPSTAVMEAGFNGLTTFKYTPASQGLKTISVTNDGGLTNPAPRSFMALGAISDSFPWVGVNQAGMEFASGTFVPPDTAFAYHVAKGFNCFRVPFMWERMQTSLGATLASAYLAQLDGVVTSITSRGAIAIIDCHNYARYGGVAINNSGAVTYALLADLWGKLAAHYTSNARVVFDLMNEPANVTAATWAAAAQVSIDAIRSAESATKHWIMVEGGGSFSRADTWVSSGNAVVLLTLTDAEDKIIFQPHSYLDSSGSGTTSSAVVGTGVSRKVEVTRWAEANVLRIFMGETGFANNAQMVIEHTAGLRYMAEHQYVAGLRGGWIGWAFWAGGAWPESYIFKLDPASFSTPVDKAQIATLQAHLPATVLNQPPYGFEVVWEPGFEGGKILPNVPVGTIVGRAYGMDPNIGNFIPLSLTEDADGQFELDGGNAIKVADALVGGAFTLEFAAFTDGISGVTITPDPVAGSVVETPADLNNILEWWTLKDAGTLAISGGKITAWTGKVNSNVVVQGTVAAQPVYSATGWDGVRPTAVYNGASSNGSALHAPGGPFGHLAIFAVTKRAAQGNSGDTRRPIVTAANIDNGLRYMLAVYRSGSDPGATIVDMTAPGASGDATARATVPFAIGDKAAIFGEFRLGVQKRIRVNNAGEDLANGNQGTESANPQTAFSIGGDTSTSPERKYAGEIVEVVVVGVSAAGVSDVYCTWLQSWFEAEWGPLG